MMIGLTYHGKAADTWAVGVTLYYVVLGQYPFLGETLQDTYDKVCTVLFASSFFFVLCVTVFFVTTFCVFHREKLKWRSFSSLLQIVNNSLELPDDMNSQLRNLLEGLLCKGQ